jgi:hypothetical protein
LVALLLIPGGAWLTHKSIVQRFGADQLDRVIKSSISDWVTAKEYSFDVAPGLTTGMAAKTSRSWSLQTFDLATVVRLLPAFTHLKKHTLR